MATRKEHAARPRRESLRKRLGLKVSRAIAARDDCRCAYCGATAEESGAALHLDHLRPASKGGLDIAKNLVTACRRCNTARQNMSLPQWSAYAASKYGVIFSSRAIWGQARRRLAA